MSRVHWVRGRDEAASCSGAHTLAHRVPAEKPDRQALFRVSLGGQVRSLRYEMTRVYTATLFSL